MTLSLTKRLLYNPEQYVTSSHTDSEECEVAGQAAGTEE